MSSAAYYYYSTTQTRIETLTRNNATLVSNNDQLNNAVNENLNTIDELRNSYQLMADQYKEIESKFQDVRSQNNELRQRLGKHDIGALAVAKPELVQNIINNASANAARCLELLSGVPLNDNELNATTSKEFNSECPWLFDGFMK